MSTIENLRSILDSELFNIHTKHLNDKKHFTILRNGSLSLVHKPRTCFERFREFIARIFTNKIKRLEKKFNIILSRIEEYLQKEKDPEKLFCFLQKYTQVVNEMYRCGGKIKKFSMGKLHVDKDRIKSLMLVNYNAQRNQYFFSPHFIFENRSPLDAFEISMSTDCGKACNWQKELVKVYPPKDSSKEILATSTFTNYVVEATREELLYVDTVAGQNTYIVKIVDTGKLQLQKSNTLPLPVPKNMITIQLINNSQQDWEMSVVEEISDIVKTVLLKPAESKNIEIHSQALLKHGFKAIDQFKLKANMKQRVTIPFNSKATRYCCFTDNAGALRYEGSVREFFFHELALNTTKSKDIRLNKEGNQGLQIVFNAGDDYAVKETTFQIPQKNPNVPSLSQPNAKEYGKFNYSYVIENNSNSEIEVNLEFSTTGTLHAKIPSIFVAPKSRIHTDHFSLIHSLEKSMQVHFKKWLQQEHNMRVSVREYRPLL